MQKDRSQEGKKMDERNDHWSVQAPFFIGECLLLPTSFIYEIPTSSVFQCGLIPTTPGEFAGSVLSFLTS